MVRYSTMVDAIVAIVYSLGGNHNYNQTATTKMISITSITVLLYYILPLLLLLLQMTTIMTYDF